MNKIKDLLRYKTGTVWTISPKATVYEALELMAEKNVGAVIVVERGQMAGIFSERDFARNSIQKGKCSLDAPVEVTMTREMITIHAEQSLEESLMVMTKHHIRHLPVIDGGRLVGMVSMRDVMEAIISKKDSDIENLENYILGTEYPR